MIRGFVIKVVKQTSHHICNALGKAFSTKYLLITNGIIAAGMSGSADSLVQKTCRHHGMGKYTVMDASNPNSKGHVDYERVLRMTLTGLLTGLVSHYWYIFLDKRFIGSTFKIVIKKTLFDQIVFAPVSICLFFMTLGLLERTPLRTMKAEARLKGPEMMLVDWMVYPPAQYINFRFLPTRFRLLYDSCIAFVIDIYYSHIKYER